MSCALCSIRRMITCEHTGCTNGLGLCALIRRVLYCVKRCRTEGVPRQGDASVPTQHHTAPAPTRLLPADQAPDIQGFGFILHSERWQFCNPNILAHSCEC